MLAAIIAAGILSRTTHTGVRLVDKYLGDALYAGMVYVLFRLALRNRSVALWAVAAMIAIELFQLTGIPAGMFRSGRPPLRACARLLGTAFSVFDLLAYAVGIGSLAVVDRAVSAGSRCRSAYARGSERSACATRAATVRVH